MDQCLTGARAQRTTSGSGNRAGSRSDVSSIGDSMHTARSGAGRSRVDDDTYSYRSAKSKDSTERHRTGSIGGVSTSTSFESIPDMIKGDGDIDSRASTPTEHLAESDQNSALHAKLEISENKCHGLEAEIVSLRNKMYTTTTVAGSATTNLDSSAAAVQLRHLEERLMLSESMFQDYRDENAVLKVELRQLQDTISHGATMEVKQLRDKLRAAEQLCEEYMDDNEQLKREIRDLQTEINESQDQYREEEIDEFRDLQRELEQTAKNCRVLQFKLRKTERQKEQAEAEKQRLEELHMRNIGSASSDRANASSPADNADGRRIRELESELRIAKEVSVRLHTELEALEDRRYKMEDENFYMKERVRELETREKRGGGGVQQQVADKRDSGSSEARAAAARQSANNLDVSTLMRDINDALERETDLRDQLKFSEDDAQGLRKKLSDMETENEGLLKQLSKLTSSSGHSASRTKSPMLRSYSEGQSQIQLELAEHENQVLKSKLAKIEKEHEELSSRANLLEKQVNRSGGRTAFSERELTAAVPDTYYKQKIKLLEEEVEEIKHKLEESRRAELEAQYGQESAWKFGEKRTKRLGKSHSLEEGAGDLVSTTDSLDSSSNAAPTGKDSPNLSISQPSDESKKGHHSMALMEQEMQVLRKRCHDIENENQRLTEENKRLKVMQRGNRSELKDKCEEMQKDIEKFVAKIATLEVQKAEIVKENQILKSKQSRSTVNNDKIDELTVENEKLQNALRSERTNTKSLESQLADYKQTLSMSENNRLVAMASRVEQLNVQLRESEERYSTVHRKLIAPAPVRTSGSAPRYEDVLRERCEQLEKDLAIVKANASFTQSASSVRQQQQTTQAGGKQGAAAVDAQADGNSINQKFEPNTGVLTNLNALVAKIIHALKAEQTTKPVSSSPSLVRTSAMRADTRAAILADVEKLKADLDQIILSSQRRSSDGGVSKISTTDSDYASSTAMTGGDEASSDMAQLRLGNEKLRREVDELRKQLEVAGTQRSDVQKQYAEATERLLKTEERWNRELDKMKDTYETQVKELKYSLDEVEKTKAEKETALNERTREADSKRGRLRELEVQVAKLQEEASRRNKDVQERIDVERKRAKEFETKYQTVESLYEQERQKVANDKDKLKTDLSELKRRLDEALVHKEKVREHHEQQAKSWEEERKSLEAKANTLQADISVLDKKVNKKAAELANAESKKLVDELTKLKTKSEKEIAQQKHDYKALQKEVEAKARMVEVKLEEEMKMKNEFELMKNRIDEQRAQLHEARKLRDETREEMTRWQQTWARERSEMLHKIRQDDKVQQAEIQTMQLKLESRMKIQEDTAKSLHGQLASTRRERDQYKEQVLTVEKKMVETKQKFLEAEKDWQQKLVNMENTSEECADLRVRLEKLEHEHMATMKEYDAERRLWTIEREEMIEMLPEKKKSANPGKYSITLGDSSTRLIEAMNVSEQLRAQIEALKLAHEAELFLLKQQLDSARKQYRKENIDNQRKIRDLQEQVKLLEIDRRNMLSSKDSHEVELITFKTERDDLLQKMHDVEIRQLTNKYKLDKISESLFNVLKTFRHISKAHDMDTSNESHALEKSIYHLESVRDEMAKTREFVKSLDVGGNDAASVKSARSGASSGKERADRAGRDEGDGDNRSHHHLRKTDSSTSNNVNGTSKPYNFLERQSSTGSDITFNNWQERIAELRKRSPSPSPRKMTAYPEAPPSIVISKEKVCEYDKDGTRHWIDKKMQRSASYDPRANYSAVVPDSALKQANEQQLFGGRQMTVDSDVSTNFDGDPPADAATTAVQTRVPSTAKATMFGDALRSVAHSGASVRDRRALFSLRKSRSVETSATGKSIGVAGMQIIAPDVNLRRIPIEVGTSQESVDTAQSVKVLPTKTTVVEDPKRSLTSIVDSFVDRIRGRSKSREPGGGAASAAAASSSAVKSEATTSTTSTSARTSPSYSTASRSTYTPSSSYVRPSYTSTTTPSPAYRPTALTTRTSSADNDAYKPSSTPTGSTSGSLTSVYISSVGLPYDTASSYLSRTSPSYSSLSSAAAVRRRYSSARFLLSRYNY